MIKTTYHKPETVSRRQELRELERINQATQARKDEQDRAQARHLAKVNRDQARECRRTSAALRLWLTVLAAVVAVVLVAVLDQADLLQSGIAHGLAYLISAAAAFRCGGCWAICRGAI